MPTGLDLFPHRLDPGWRFKWCRLSLLQWRRSGGDDIALCDRRLVDRGLAHRMLGPAGCDVGVDAARLQRRKIGVRAIAIVS